MGIWSARADQQDHLNAQWVPNHNKGVGNFSFAAHVYQLFDDSVAGKFCSTYSHAFQTVIENFFKN